MKPRPKNKDVKIWDIIKECKFVGGQTYWTIDSAIYEEQEFKKGTKICWVDPDEEFHVEYCGNIEWLMIDERGNVEVSIDNLQVGRLDLEELIKI